MSTKSCVQEKIFMTWKHLSKKKKSGYLTTDKVLSQVCEKLVMNREAKHENIQNIIIQLKKKGILTDTTTWMNLRAIMLSEISQAEKDKYL